MKEKESWRGRQLVGKMIWHYSEQRFIECRILYFRSTNTAISNLFLVVAVEQVQSNQELLELENEKNV